MMPLDVPSAIVVDIAMLTGRPKLRFPTSEKACPDIFRNLVHRTTSQGA